MSTERSQATGSSQSNSVAAPWTRKRLDVNHSMIHDATGTTVVPRMITEPGAPSERKGDLIAAAPELAEALHAALAFIGQTPAYKVGHTGAHSISEQGIAALRKAGLL